MPWQFRLALFILGLMKRKCLLASTAYVEFLTDSQSLLKLIIIVKLFLKIRRIYQLAAFVQNVTDDAANAFDDKINVVDWPVRGRLRVDRGRLRVDRGRLRV